MTTCSAIASTTGRPCRNRALQGGCFCEVHEPDQVAEFIGGPEDGNALSIGAVRGCRNVFVAATAEGRIRLYRPWSGLPGEVLGRYRLQYVGSTLAWVWERDGIGVEAVR